MAESNGNGNSKLTLWIMGALFSVIMAMMGYFVSDLRSDLERLQREMTSERDNRKVDLQSLNVRLSGVERTQNERGSNVSDIPSMRSGLSDVRGKVGILERDIEGLRRNTRDLRDNIANVYTLIGRPPPARAPEP